MRWPIHRGARASERSMHRTPLLPIAPSSRDAQTRAKPAFSTSLCQVDPDHALRRCRQTAGLSAVGARDQMGPLSAYVVDGKVVILKGIIEVVAGSERLEVLTADAGLLASLVLVGGRTFSPIKTIEQNVQHAARGFDL